MCLALTSKSRQTATRSLALPEQCGGGGLIRWDVKNLATGIKLCCVAFQAGTYFMPHTDWNSVQSALVILTEFKMRNFPACILDLFLLSGPNRRLIRITLLRLYVLP